MENHLSPNLPKKAFLIGELAAVKRTIAQKDEEMRQMEERLQRLELAYERPQRGRQHRDLRSYKNYGGHEDADEWMRHPFEDRRQNVAKPFLPYVKLPSFSGESDPNVYLGWEAKVEQIFNMHEVQDVQKAKLAFLEFLDYAMQWWHTLVMDIGLNKRPAVVSWEDFKECMHARFVPPHYRKKLLLKLQRLQQGTQSVDTYFKELETTLTKVDMHESEESKMARFVSRLRRDIQDVVELYEYTSLEKLVHLASKVKSQI